MGRGFNSMLLLLNTMKKTVLGLPSESWGLIMVFLCWKSPLLRGFSGAGTREESALDATFVSHLSASYVEVPPHSEMVLGGRGLGGRFRGSHEGGNPWWDQCPNKKRTLVLSLSHFLSLGRTWQERGQLQARKCVLTRHQIWWLGLGPPSLQKCKK